MEDITAAGGVAGRTFQLLVRDTAGTPGIAAAAVEELVGLGVTAAVGEYHSVVARAVAAAAGAAGVPFVCASAVLDELTDHPTEMIGRVAPLQSYGWPIFADYLLSQGCDRLALAVGPGLYWASGAEILRDHVTAAGGSVVHVDMASASVTALLDEVRRSQVHALLLLVGYPEPAVGIVKGLRQDRRLRDVLIGAPAGQPEFAGWHDALESEGTAVPFLRYMPERDTSVGAVVHGRLEERLRQPPSFVAFEGYDAAVALAGLLELHLSAGGSGPLPWSEARCEGARGTIVLSRPAGASVWQWMWPPVQVVDRDPESPSRFRVLHSAAPSSNGT